VEGTEITAEGLATVTEHLAQFGEYGPNTMMLQRLQAALEAGETLTGADANFYMHELYEAGLHEAGRLSELMAQGMDFEGAQGLIHQETLQALSQDAMSLYHPEVIEAFPEAFNSVWRQYWGLP
jgi:hypothetical protein